MNYAEAASLSILDCKIYLKWLLLLGNEIFREHAMDIFFSIYMLTQYRQIDYQLWKLSSKATVAATPSLPNSFLPCFLLTPSQNCTSLRLFSKIQSNCIPKFNPQHHHQLLHEIALGFLRPLWFSVPSTASQQHLLSTLPQCVVSISKLPSPIEN